METRVKRVERDCPFGRLGRHQHAKRALPVGHIVSAVELRLGERRGLAFIRRRNHRQRHRPKAPDPLCTRREVVPLDAIAAVRCQQLARQGTADRRPQRLSRCVDRAGIDDLHPPGNQRP